MGRMGRSLLKKRYHQKGIEILGPSAAPFTKMRGKFRWQMLAKGRGSQSLHQFAQEVAFLLEGQTKGTGVHLDIDVDPVFIL
jgi:primosomal protein N' (replication factor Y)